MNRIDANRRNPAVVNKSTGPKTPEGKLRSSRNAVKHGCYAVDNVIPALGESEQEFLARLKRWEDSLRPVGELEFSLTKRLCTLDRRLDRMDRIEAGYYDNLATKLETKSLIPLEDGTLDSPHKTMDQLTGNTFSLSFTLNESLEYHSRIQARVFSQYFKTIKILTEVQKQRLSQPPPQPPIQNELPPESTSARSTSSRPPAPPPALRIVPSPAPTPTPSGEITTEGPPVCAEITIK